jgi:hypothetical protein
MEENRFFFLENIGQWQDVDGWTILKWILER